jgi:hypothetical protein
MAKHEEKTGHLRQVRFHKFQDLLKEAEKDKNGVIVEGEFDFGVVELTEMGPCLERGGTMRTMSPDVNVTLLEASLGSRTKEQKPSYVLIRCFNVNDLIMIPARRVLALTVKDITAYSSALIPFCSPSQRDNASMAAAVTFSGFFSSTTSPTRSSSSPVSSELS